MIKKKYGYIILVQLTSFYLIFNIKHNYIYINDKNKKSRCAIAPVFPLVYI